jgi:hypothetical protein
MPILGKPAAAVAAGLVMLAVGPASASIAAPRAAQSPPAVAGGASASVPPASEASIDLTFDVKNLQGSLVVRLNPAGITADEGGIVMARSGAMDAVYQAGLVFLLSVSGRIPLDALATRMLRADTAVITGDATVPPGATVTVTNSDTGQKLDLQTGPFSIRTGPGAGRDQEVTFSPVVAPGKAVTGAELPGRPVKLEEFTGSSAQLWRIPHPDSGSITEIINKQTGLCLDAAHHAAGAKVITTICDGSKHQRWAEHQRPDGSWRLSQGRSGPILQAAVSARTGHVRLEPLTSPRKLRSWVRRTRVGSGP